MSEFLKEHHTNRQNAKKASNERWNQMATIELPADFDFEGLLAGTRKRGMYAPPLKEFMEAENPEKGIAVDLTAGEFKGKKPMTVAQGFKLAAEKLGYTNLRVIPQEDRVILINTDLV